MPIEDAPVPSLDFIPSPSTDPKPKTSSRTTKPAPRYTAIQWAFDTVNPVSGCQGCELRPQTLRASLAHPMARGVLEKELRRMRHSWSNDGEFKDLLSAIEPMDGPRLLKKVQVCYAGKIVDNRCRRGVKPALKGYLDSFDVPTAWRGRMEDIVRKPDLRGVAVEEKPWFPAETPRVVFVGSMGDTFSRSIEFDDIKRYVLDPILTPEGQRHVYMLLTKDPSRLREFCIWLWDAHGMELPDNVMVGTSVTSPATLGRVRTLLDVRAKLRFVSFEPIWAYVDLNPHLGPGKIDLLIAGGESGPIATPVEIDVFRALRDDARKCGCSFFLKQLGQQVRDQGKPIKYEDAHAGDWNEWPEDLRVREFPAC